MQFGAQVVTEVTAPNNVPFAPGQDVIGIGTQVPPELIAAGYPNAIVAYSSDWNPASVTPLRKFSFLAAAPGTDNALVAGFGWCVNPSVSQTATVIKAFTVGQPVSGSQDPVLKLYDGPGALRAVLFHLTATAQTTLQMAGWQLNVADGATLASVNNPIMLDTSWQPFTLFNGWTGLAGADTPFYRAMPDGTIAFTGALSKASAPVNGEQCLSVAAGYVPRGRVICSVHSVLTGSGQQKLLLDATGAGFIFDSPAGNGSAFLSEIRYPGTTLP